MSDIGRWCEEENVDPEDEDSWEYFNKVVCFCDDLDEDNREGWEHNMNKDD